MGEQNKGGQKTGETIGMGQKKVGQFPAYQMVGSESWTVEEQVKNDWGLGMDSCELGLDGWKTSQKWFGARHGQFRARPGWIKSKSRMVGG